MVDEQGSSGKIPVGQTIARAYNFAFSNYVTVLRLVWLPLLITYIATYFLMPAVAAIYTGVAIHDMTPVLKYVPQMLALETLILVLFVMQFAIILPHTLGLKTEIPTFSFPLGKPFWRLILASFIISLIAFAVMIVAAMIGGLIGGVLAVSRGGVGKGASPAETAAAITRFTGPITAVLMYTALLALIARQVFLLAPVIIAEERLGIGHAWVLSRGNFWRICLIILAILLPLIVLDVAYLAFFTPDILNPNGDRTKALTAPIDMMQKMQSYWYIVYPAFALVLTFFNGLICAAQSFAYLARVPLEKTEDVFQ
jgi:hypothetical protein